MEYLALAYQSAATHNRLSRCERRMIAEACRENNGILRERGTLLLAATLEGCDPAVTRVRNGKVSVVNTEARLLSIYLINANDMNDALRTVSTMPQARLGIIEVRAVLEREAGMELVNLC